MPVNTEHPDYVRLKPVWHKMRTVAAGQRAVHGARELFLPRLADESEKAYDARLKRSSFFNATGRTIEGLRGMIFRTKPKTKVSAAVEAYLQDVTKTGVDLDTLAANVTHECLEVGRVGLMVDYPKADVSNLTQAQAEALNLRPHMALYKAEAIINWETAWLDNRTMLTKVVLYENARIAGKDEFDFKTEPRYRVLDLVQLELKPGEFGRAYRVREYRKATNGGDELVEMFVPKMNSKPLPYIPFQFIGVDDTTPDADPPPLEDLANVNLSHYLSTSDRKHGAHLTALPQPWANKVTPQTGPNGEPVEAKWHIGGGDLWAFPGDTQVGMLEYTGQGLGTLKEEIEREEKQMAVLGARMLEQQKAGVETAEAAGIHRAGEQSSLAAMAGVISRGMRQALAWFDQWGNGTGDVSFDLNRDYFPNSLTAQDLTALVSAWQQGALSKEELFYKLQSGGAIRESTDYETHEAQIAESSPMLSATPTATGKPGGKTPAGA